MLYGDVDYKNDDIKRIIEYKERRLKDLEMHWQSFTKNMEMDEIKDLKQSCIDDEIIVSCLNQGLYVNGLIKKIENAIEELAHNVPKIEEFKDGNYVVKFNPDIWDVETATKFLEFLFAIYPNSSFTMLPGVDLYNVTDNKAD